MRKELQHIAKIDQYLLGVLSAADKLEFEQQLAVDPNLKHAISDHQSLTEHIEEIGFREEMMKFHNENFMNPELGKNGLTKGSKFLKSLLFIVGSAVVVGIIYFLNSFGNNKDAVSNEFKSEVVLEQPKKVNPEMEIPKHLTVPFITETVNVKKGKDILMNASGSMMHIPPHAFVHTDGSPVKGEVDINYREFRTSAEMAFSEIPMSWHEDGDVYDFISAGMFEIRGFQNENEVFIKEGTIIDIDYNLTNPLDNLNFYSLDDETKLWEEICPLNPKEKLVLGDEHQNNNLLVGLEGKDGEMHATSTDEEHTEGEEKPFSLPRFPGSITEYLMRTMQYPYTTIKNNITGKVKVEYWVDIKGNISNVRVIEKGDHILLDKAAVYAIQKLPQWIPAKKEDGIPLNVTVQTYVPFLPKNNCTEFELDLAREFEKKLNSMEVAYGHTGVNEGINKNEEILDAKKGTIDYSKNVYKSIYAVGLQVRRFGYHNCDQVRRDMRFPMLIDCSFVNENDESIDNLYMFTKIDLNINSALSGYDKTRVDKYGDNLILVIGLDSKLYICSREDFKAMHIEKDGEYTFKVKEITNKVSSINDLDQLMRE